MSEEKKIFSQRPRKPKEPKYWGLTWLTLKEAAEKMLISVPMLLKMVKENRIPYRTWGKTYRFIAEELDAWEGIENGIAKKNPVVPISAIINKKFGKTWLTLKHAAKKFKVSVEWLKRVGIKKGIPHIKLGKVYRFTVEDLDDFPGFTNDTTKKLKTPIIPTIANSVSVDSLMEGFNNGYK